MTKKNHHLEKEFRKKKIDILSGNYGQGERDNDRKIKFKQKGILSDTQKRCTHGKGA